MQLAAVKDMHGTLRLLHLGLSGTTILSAWAFIHTVFAQHYAHEYFVERESEKDLQTNRAVFDRAGQAIMAKIMENQDAAEALKVTTNPRVTAAGAQVPKGLKDAAE